MVWKVTPVGPRPATAGPTVAKSSRAHNVDQYFQAYDLQRVLILWLQLKNSVFNISHSRFVCSGKKYSSLDQSTVPHLEYESVSHRDSNYSAVFYYHSI